MNSYSSMLRRRSQEALRPEMPRKVYSRQDGQRTQYQELPPQEQLKYFRRKQIYFQNTKQPSKKHNRYPSQTTPPQAQMRKYDTLPTMHTEHNSKNITMPPPIISPFYLDNNNLDGDAEEQEKPQQHEGDENNQNNGNIEELDGYAEGNQAQQDEEQSEGAVDKLLPKRKKYCTSGIGSEYSAHEELAHARMEQKFWQREFRNLKNRHEDNEFLDIYNHYKIRKKALLKESSRRVESYRMLASLRKAQSLPKLVPTSQKVLQITVPSYEQIKTGERNPEQNRRIIANRILQGSFSTSKLMQAPKKPQFSELQTEIQQIKKIQQKFREKGIKFDSDALKKSLLNMRTVPINIKDQQIYQQPRRLPSNPLLRYGF